MGDAIGFTILYRRTRDISADCAPLIHRKRNIEHPLSRLKTRRTAAVLRPLHSELGPIGHWQ